MSNPVLRASELQQMTRDALEISAGTGEELVDDWLCWFEKRGERFLSSAAKFGYSSATLDLPLQLATKLEKAALKRLIKELVLLLPGTAVCLVEEEYEGQTLYKIEVSWKQQQIQSSD